MSTAALSGAKRRLHPGAILAAVCVACVLLPISLTGASVALPAIGVGLHGGLAAVQWVVNGYDLTFAGIMLAAGSLSDRIGRKRMFAGGLSLFGIAALISAVAPNILVLDIVRAIAGVGAAGVLTSGAAILATAFEEGPGRAKAFAMLGTSFGLGIAFGPAISGVEIAALGWRGVFVSHAVVAAILVLTALRFVPESRNPEPGKFDWPGNITFTLALSLFILVLIEGPQWGWGSPATIGSLIAFAAMLIAFPIVERRSKSPMFDVSLLVNPRFAAISLVPVALAFGFTAVLMLLPSYFSSVDGAGAGASGLLLMLMTVPTLILPMVGGWLTKHTSNRVILVVSLLLTTAGAAWLTVIQPGSWVLGLAGPLVLIGAGFGLSLGILDGAAVSTVETERAGMAAGMFNTMRLASEVVAIAAMGALVVTLTQSGLASGIGRFTGVFSGGADALANSAASGELGDAVSTVPAGATRQAFETFATGGYTSAMHTVLWVLAGICLVSAGVVGALLKTRKAEETKTEDAPVAVAEVVEVG